MNHSRTMRPRALAGLALALTLASTHSSPKQPTTASKASTNGSNPSWPNGKSPA